MGRSAYVVGILFGVNGEAVGDVHAVGEDDAEERAGDELVLLVVFERADLAVVEVEDLNDD